MGLSDLFSSNNNNNDKAPPPSPSPPHLLIIITDQERSIQHWPEDFTSTHLPNLSRLMSTGMTFHQAFTGACMCSPSRATFLTSRYPTETGVKTTGSPEPRVKLPTDITNLAHVLRNAGYESVAWRGKWHLGGRPEEYGFEGWVPPDAGNYLSLNDTLGGGTPDNDDRFLNEAFDYLEKRAKSSDGKPFCLVTSFVNPHDVYVAQYEPELGYTKDDFHKLTVPVPDNANEDLEQNNKPRAQICFSWPYVPHENSMQEYCNFYAYLHTIVDAQIGRLLDKMDDLQLTKNTLVIRFADHGEQALNHGLVEKFFNVYEESIRIPFIFSNPIAFPNGGQTTDFLASSLDLLPTLASLLGTYEKEQETEQQKYASKSKSSSKSSSKLQGGFKGRDLSPILLRQQQSAENNNNNNIHFTYDDIGAFDGSSPSIIRCIRTSRYKYAVYFTKTGTDADWELYDLTKDPNENDNLAGRSEHLQLQIEMDIQLVSLMKEMHTLPTKFKWPPKATRNSRGKLPSAAISMDDSSESSSP